MSDQLDDQEEVLFRQIHPKFIEGGVPADNRFRPSRNDKNFLSVDRSSIHNASESHRIYTFGGHRDSAAVFGVSVGEFLRHGIPCRPDPTLAKDGSETGKPQLENKAHSLADYSSFSEADQKLISKKLKLLAVARGKLHP